jgi:DNA repair protein RadC
VSLTNFLCKIKESPIELMGVIYHDASGVAGFRIVGEGTVDGCKFRFIDVVAGMLAFRSNMLTLIHNHVRGDVRPSVQDLEMTYAMIDRCKERNVTIRDHLIIGKEGGIYSFAENGAL